MGVKAKVLAATIISFYLTGCTSNNHSSLPFTVGCLRETELTAPPTAPTCCPCGDTLGQHVRHNGNTSAAAESSFPSKAWIDFKSSRQQRTFYGFWVAKMATVVTSLGGSLNFSHTEPLKCLQVMWYYSVSLLAPPPSKKPKNTWHCSCLIVLQENEGECPPFVTPHISWAKQEKSS